MELNSAEGSDNSTTDTRSSDDDSSDEQESSDEYTFGKQDEFDLSFD